MTLIIVCAAAVLGVAVGEVRPLAPGPLVAVAILAAIGCCCTWRWPRVRLAGMVASAVALGAARAALVIPLPNWPSGGEWLTHARAAADGRVHAYLPEPQASLSAGVLLGGSVGLDPLFRLELQRSGLSHLVAIDGFKQVVVAATVGLVATRLLGARWAVLPVLGVVGGYTLLTGAHPSAIRAALMVGLATLGGLSGRVADPLTSLMLAATAMAAFEPGILFDLGLQLSLSATLGIVLLWPWIRRFLRRLPRLVAEPVGLTLAVTLATLPVVLGTFHQVSLVSPLAHIVAVPLLPVVLVSTGVLAAVAPAPLLGTAAAWVAWLPSSALVAIVRLFGDLPAASISTGRLPTGAALAMAGVLLAGGTWRLPELTQVRRRFARWRGRHPALLFPLACIGVCLGAICTVDLLKPDGRLHVEPLDSAGGQAVFVRAPSGESALIVAGRIDPTTLTDQLADRLAVWEHRLNRAVALDDASNIALTRVLSRYPADERVESTGAIQLDLRGPAVVNAALARDGQLRVEVETARSGPTTSAARPESAN